jgi:hypothetical protein
VRTPNYLDGDPVLSRSRHQRPGVWLHFWQQRRDGFFASIIDAIDRIQ